MNLFSFYKGTVDTIAPQSGERFDWHKAASKVRESVCSALNARNVSFLLGSGCSSYLVDGSQVGVPTMMPMASEFVSGNGTPDDTMFITEDERQHLSSWLGIHLEDAEYSQNLERLLEVLFSLRFVQEHTNKQENQEISDLTGNVITKVTSYILNRCTSGAFSSGNDTVLKLYQSFYQKLTFRDRSLPSPWVFTTNYDLFNETAMDRSLIPFINGFSGVIERRFNPATYRYSLADQMDIVNQKWTAVENLIYLCKLHGSVNWIEEPFSLYPIREFQAVPDMMSDRVMIYPTPMKQRTSLGSPYTDLFREFQSRIVRDQSVLFVIGYSFNDAHVNSIIFQALTVPTFRLIAFVQPSEEGVIKQLKELDDPRVWLIGGNGHEESQKAHFFSTVVSQFMPELPSERTEQAVAKALQSLLGEAMTAEGGKVQEDD